MQIDDWESCPELTEIYQDIRKYDLVENVAELDAFGFTVVPPEKVAPPEFQDRLKQAILDVHERRTGQTVADIENGTTGVEGPLAGHFGILMEGRPFEEAVLNPAVYALARYQCGQSVVLSDMLCLLKNQDPTPTHLLHTDQHGTPPPLPQYPQVTNITWVQTDYTADNGPVAIVPGSHRFGRRPRPYEADFLAADAPVKAIPVEAPAGSLIVWGGTTWHGSFPRKAAGLRINLIMVFCRSYMRPIHDFRDEVGEGFFDRNPPEMADLLALNHPYPFRGHEFPPNEHVQRFIHSGTNQWA
jgi:ectoine hydroxylase-related dioxygenase (phytanoyl-CoA dioxygenase family)